MEPATRILSEFVTDGSAVGLPDDLWMLSKQYLLDTIGAMVIGSGKPWAQIVSGFSAGVGGTTDGPSTIVAYPTKTLPQMAAFANGNMGHGFEIDDVHDESLTHPGVAVVPAALAVAEETHSSGEELLLSIVMGYELISRVGLGVGSVSHMLGGFYPTGTNGVFGAAAAAGRLLKLTAEQLTYAMGTAGSFASGIVEYSVSGGMVKRLHAGRAAEGGVTAAYLARNGFTGPTTVLEGKFGYCRTFSRAPDLPRLLENLGSEYKIRQITVKPYFCCSDIHPVIDALLDIKRENTVSLGDVEHILVESTTKLFELNSIPGHTSMMAAQYSVPFTAALVLTREIKDPAIYHEGILQESVLQALQDKVEMRAIPEFDALYPRTIAARVTITLQNGKKLVATNRGATGSIHKPMSKVDIEEKFMRLADPILPAGNAAKVLRLVDDIKDAPDIHPVMALLRFEQRDVSKQLAAE